jgi:hypothetical protein
VAAGVLLLAIRDLRKGRQCNGTGGPCGRGGVSGVHVCAANAERFLMSDYAAELLDLLDLDPSVVRERLGLNGDK